MQANKEDAMFRLIGISDLQAIIEVEGSQVITYNADGTVNFITLTLRGATYRKTYSYAAGQVATVSVWEEL